MREQSRSGPSLFTLNPRSELLALTRIPFQTTDGQGIWRSNFHISEWDLPMLCTVMDEFYTVLWSIQLTLGTSYICLHLLLTKGIVMNSEFPIWWSFEQESLPWYTVKLLCILPFIKPKKKKEYKLSFFFVKTYGSNHFQLKTKAWNNYQMYDSVAQIEVEKKVCKLSTSISNQPFLYLISIQIPAPPPYPGQTFRWNQPAIFHWLNS